MTLGETGSLALILSGKRWLNGDAASSSTFPNRLHSETTEVPWFFGMHDMNMEDSFLSTVVVGRVKRLVGRGKRAAKLIGAVTITLTWREVNFRTVQRASSG